MSAHPHLCPRLPKLQERETGADRAELEAIEALAQEDGQTLIALPRAHRWQNL